MWITQGRAYSGKMECEQAERKQRKNLVKPRAGKAGLLVVVLHYIPEQVPYHLRDYGEPFPRASENEKLLVWQKNLPVPHNLAARFSNAV